MASSMHKDKYRLFRRMLVEARKAAGLTQMEVALRLDKPQSFVSKYERGERRIDVTEFVALSEALSMDPLALLEAYIECARKEERQRGNCLKPHREG